MKINVEQAAADWLNDTAAGAKDLAGDALAKWNEFRTRAAVYMAQAAVSRAAGNEMDAELLMDNTIGEMQGLRRELTIDALGLSEARIEDLAKTGVSFLVGAILKAGAV